MTTKIQWLGHSCFYIESNSHKILIDPFLTGNPAASLKAADLKADFILVSHGHGDHVGDSLEVLKATGATLVSNFEVCSWLNGKGVEKYSPGNHGGRIVPTDVFPPPSNDVLVTIIL